MRIFLKIVGESSDWITFDEDDTATEQEERTGNTKDPLSNI